MSLKNMDNNIIIIAGEPSADMHGAALVQELKLLSPDLKIAALGGKRMGKAGAEIFADLSQYAVIGFVEVLKHIQIFKKTFELTLKKIKDLKPQAVILIDFPGFNLRLAKRIKKDSPQIKIVYYISPQIWAWGKKRIKLIRKVVDKMIVVFEFEKQLYSENSINVEFVGHPLLEIVKCTKEKNKLLEELKFTPQDKIIALLPGSRRIEVERILPVMIKAAEILAKEMPDLKFILLKASNIKNQLIDQLLGKYNHLNIAVKDKNRYDFLSICSFAWVCSGTATLETAILGIPMLIIYKTSFSTWLVSTFLIALPYIGLVNIVAGEKIVPEFIQYQARPENIMRCSLEIFSKGPEFQNNLKQRLNAVREKLKGKNANIKAARAILRLITEEASCSC